MNKINIKDLKMILGRKFKVIVLIISLISLILPNSSFAAINSVTTQQETNLTSNSATLNGTVDTTTQAYARFRYSTISPGTCNNTFGTATSYTSMGAGVNNYSANVSLNQSTTYYFCAIAVNDPNNPTQTVFGALRQFTTPAGSGPGTLTITTDPADPVGTNSATLKATITISNMNAYVQFRYKMGSSGGTCAGMTGYQETLGQSFNYAGQQGPFSLPMSQQVGGLQINTLYSFCAIDVANNVYGAIRTFTTQGGPPPPAIITLVVTESASNITQSSATLNAHTDWNEDPQQGGQQVVFGQFRYGTQDPGIPGCSASYGTGTTFQMLDPNPNGGWTNFSAPLTGLPQGTKYYYCAVVVNNPTTPTETKLGNVVTFTTTTPAGGGGGGGGGGGNSIGTVTTLSVANLTDSSTTLRGNVTSTGGATAYAYFRLSVVDVPPLFCNQIYGSNMVSVMSTFPNQSSVISSGNFSGVISDLAPDTLYSYCAVVSNQVPQFGQANTEIKYGKVVTFKTLPCQTCPHTSVQTKNASVLSPVSATLNGSYSSTKATSTLFEYRKKGTSGGSNGGSNLPGNLPQQFFPWIPTSPVQNNLAFTYKNYSKTLTDLEANTEYEFRAVAKTTSPSEVFNGKILSFKTPLTSGVGNFNDSFDTPPPGSFNGVPDLPFTPYVPPTFTPPTGTCPPGYSGTPPNCLQINTPCPAGPSNDPNCNVPNNPATCPYGYTGTYPKCIPPDITVPTPFTPTPFTPTPFVPMSFTPPPYDPGSFTSLTPYVPPSFVPTVFNQNSFNPASINTNNNFNNTFTGVNGTGTFSGTCNGNVCSGSWNGVIPGAPNGSISGTFSGPNGTGTFTGTCTNGVCTGTWTGANPLGLSGNTLGTWTGSNGSGNFGNNFNNTFTGVNGTGTFSGTCTGNVCSGSWNGVIPGAPNGSISGTFSGPNGTGTFTGTCTNGVCTGTWTGTNPGGLSGNTLGTWTGSNGSGTNNNFTNIFNGVNGSGTLSGICSTTTCTGTWTGLIPGATPGSISGGFVGFGAPSGGGTFVGTCNTDVCSGTWSVPNTSNLNGSVFDTWNGSNGNGNFGNNLGTNIFSGVNGTGTFSGTCNGTVCSGSWNGVIPGAPNGSISGTFSGPNGTGTFTGTCTNGVCTGTWTGTNPGGLSGNTLGTWNGSNGSGNFGNNFNNNLLNTNLNGVNNTILNGISGTGNWTNVNGQTIWTGISGTQPNGTYSGNWVGPNGSGTWTGTWNNGVGTGVITGGNFTNFKTGTWVGGNNNGILQTEIDSGTWISPNGGGTWSGTFGNGVGVGILSTGTNTLFGNNLGTNIFSGVNGTGTFSGTCTGSICSGTWSGIIPGQPDGSVSGTFTGPNGTGTFTGTCTNGVCSGTWTGTNPGGLSGNTLGTWNGSNGNGSTTGLPLNTFSGVNGTGTFSGACGTVSAINVIGSFFQNFDNNVTFQLKDNGCGGTWSGIMPGAPDGAISGTFTGPNGPGNYVGTCTNGVCSGTWVGANNKNINGSTSGTWNGSVGNGGSTLSTNIFSGVNGTGTFSGTCTGSICSGTWSGIIPGQPDGSVSGTFTGPNGTGTFTGTCTNGVCTGTWTGTNNRNINGSTSGTWNGSVGNGGGGLNGNGIWVGSKGTNNNVFNGIPGTGNWTGNCTSNNCTGTWSGIIPGQPDGAVSGTFKGPMGTGTFTGTCTKGVCTGTWKGGTGNGLVSGTWTGSKGTGSNIFSGVNGSGTWTTDNPGGLCTWTGISSTQPDGTYSGTSTGGVGPTSWTGTWKNGIGTGTCSGVKANGPTTGTWVGDKGDGSIVMNGLTGKGTWVGKDKDGVWMGFGNGEGTGLLKIGSTVTPWDDAIVRYHEGVETVFIRQIMHRPDLAKRYGYKEGTNLLKFAQRLAHFWAIDFGYYTKGKEVRVLPWDVAAYLLWENGNKLIVYEIFKEKVVAIRTVSSILKDKYNYEYYYSKKR